ncbi:hypothetical protein MYAM1_000613 [Malassezia yamatoensis]|uniref:Uncharacterized protein n=1 Tax=Malassezia yamatoensis TaxID=253288 RepID=A0AAJ5YPT1_9BASI|nr:hypothetical protein MYAM1_000613 [Malassezia yamatoensis]
MVGAEFWARALYCPLESTLEEWEKIYEPSRRFLEATRFLNILVDGTEPEKGPKVTREPEVLDVPVHIWLPQRLIIAYVCHAPYIKNSKAVPSRLQPFRQVLELLYNWLKRREDEGWAPRWWGMYSKSGVDAVQDCLYQFLYSPRSTVEIGAVVPAVLCELPMCPHQQGLTRLEVDRPIYLLQRAMSASLSIPEQRSLVACLQRCLVQGADECFLFDSSQGPQNAAQIAGYNASIAYEWVACVVSKDEFPLSFWEELGEACAQRANASLGAQRRIHEFLAQISTPKSSSSVHLGAQLYTLPRYLALRAQHLNPIPDGITEELCLYIAQLVEKNLLPIHPSQRVWETPQPEDALDALAVELRSMALAYSKYAFGAQLFHALVRA